MARQSRIVVPDVVHHVVARGVDRMRIFRNGYDKERYLKRAAIIADEERILVHGFCLMENHVHFLLTPTTKQGLARFFSRLHTWWAMYLNKKLGRSGHLFQSRFFSSTLSESHYWTAIRYVELNSVRAGLARCAEEWDWSSARDHVLLRSSPLILLSPVPGRKLVPLGDDWRHMLQADQTESHDDIRKALTSSRPCGPEAYVKELAKRFSRRWRLPLSHSMPKLSRAALTQRVRGGSSVSEFS